jgi:c-di-AMP phosphodiesterase-like protein
MTTAIGIISLDNYDDVIDKMDDKHISYLNTLVTTLVSDWASEYHVFYKRINSERYFFVADTADVLRMQEKNFDLLQHIKNSEVHNELVLTISMGIAYGEASAEKIGEIAQSNLDMALARGGDQVVVKHTDPQAKPQFFGGNTDGTIKRTRTRSRAMSMSLNRIFKDNQKIFIMGHRYPDMDAIGAAFGVATLGKFISKECYIILNREEVTADITRGLAEIDNYPEVKNLVISSKEALKLLDKQSVLVMVDYHKPSMSISEEVYEAVEKIVIIDHHRRGDEFPINPLLTYIEASASSASELVAELIQYQANKNHQLSKITATLLLAGIYVDTKSFAVRTTGRTFDVASYLKNHGADLSIVHDLLSSDLEAYLQISELVSRSEYVTPEIVVSVGPEDKEYDNVTIAKAADTLLSMNDIQAAFVITKRLDQRIGISARSSGKVNVQRLMENFGGGGHFTNAATQIEGQTLEKVREMLFNELRILAEKEQST